MSYLMLCPTFSTEASSSSGLSSASASSTGIWSGGASPAAPLPPPSPRSSDPWRAGVVWASGT